VTVDVLLASAPHADTFGYSMPPPGLLRLGGALERAGVSVALEDLAFRLAEGGLAGDDRLADAAAELLLEGGGPRLVLGISCMGATLPAALAIAQRVRARRADLAIVLGGPGTTSIESALVERFPFVDAVVRGEGEVVVLEVVERARARGVERALDLGGVSGTTWRARDGRVVVEPDRTPLADLDSLPPPAWHLVPSLARYKAITGAHDGLVPVDSGRGCVYDCSFCSIGRTWKRRSRVLPVPRLVEEMLAAAALPSAKQVYLCHDIFGADRKHALALCAELERRGRPVPFEVRARVDHLDDELVAAMGRAGCYRVLLGIESGDADLRNLHGKRIDRELDVLARIRALDRAGVAPILSLVLGLPGEGDPELAHTLDLCLDAALAAPVHLSLHLPNPQPGCRLGEEDAGRSRPIAELAPDMAFGAGTTAPERAFIDAHPDLFGTFAVDVAAAGGLDRARFLRRLADELASVLMRFPRTFALCARAARLDVLALARAWFADGRSFESFALGSNDSATIDALRWEQAIVRVGALGDAPPQLVQSAVVCDVCFDPRTDPLAWREAPFAPREVRHLAVTRRGAAARTVMVQAGLARALREMDGRDPAEIAHDHELAPLLDALAQRGLVQLPRPLAPTAVR
jgi:radical SAM superfamily enzyme YgiQ (UPF0313 family)